MAKLAILAIAVLLLASHTKAQRQVCGLLDICFMIDSSGSIGQNNWDIVLNFTKSFVDSFDIGPTRFGTVVFSTNVYVEFGLDTYRTKDDIKNKLSFLTWRAGWTQTADGFDTAAAQCFGTTADRPGARNILVVVTDGQPTEPERSDKYAEDRAKLAADDIKNKGVFVIAVGITDSVKKDFLKYISSYPQQENVTYFAAAKFSALEGLVNNLVASACLNITTPTPPTTTTTRPITDCRGREADVVFIIDASGSIGELNFQKIKQFVSDVVDRLDIDFGRSRVGLETFSDRTRIEFQLQDYSSRSEMMQAISKIRYTRGTTNTDRALQSARDVMFTSRNGDRNGVDDIIIIITDGESGNQANTLREAQQTKNKGIHIISIGIGNWLNEYELMAISSFPSEKNYIHVSNVDALNNVVTTIQDAVCDNENECNSYPCRNGATCHNGVKDYWCECRVGYSGKNCEERCLAGGDIVFALDTSGSIGRANFKKIVDFVTDVVQRLDIDNANNGGNTGVRVGVELFSTTSTIQFNLKDYLTKKAIMNALSFRYTGGTTDTAAAIRTAREQMFTSGNGDRRDAPNFLVVITDGKSNNRDETWKEAVETRKDGITVIAVGIGGGVDQVELQGMASDPVDKNVLQVKDFTELNSVLTTLTTGLCNNVNECNGNPCFNGARCTDKVNGYECGPCPRGYTGVNCERVCSGLADIAFVVDSSGSIRSERFPIVLDYISSIIARLDVHPDRARVAMVYWSDNSVLHFDLDDYSNRQDVIAAVKRTPFMGGRTATSSALLLILNDIFQQSRGDRPEVPNYGIVVTDGNSNINPEKTIPQAILDRVGGIHLIVLAVGTDVNRLELDGIASYPVKENVFTVKSIRDLTPPSPLTDTLTQAFCDDRDECASNPCTNGGTCVNGLKHFRCLCREGRTGYTCRRRCSRSVDVSLILDLSGSVDDVYTMTVEFAKYIVDGLDMNYDRARISAIGFSTSVIDSFRLDQYNNKDHVKIALNFYRSPDRTNIQRALQVMRNDIFTSRRGDRSGVSNVAILITDGHATINAGGTVPEAERAKQSGVELYTVATTANPNMGMLNDISSDPDSDHVFKLARVEDISSVGDDLLDNICGS